DNLDINWISEKPSDSDFHNAANAYQSHIDKRLYADALQNHINTKSRQKEYDNGFACASYANSTNETWKQEALDFIAWRDACWQYAIDIQAQIEANQIPAP